MATCNNPKCNKELTGRQKKWCSRECQYLSSNFKHQNYQAQQARGKSRKAEIVKLKGGGCEKCGYNKCMAALQFHHRDPSLKKFQLDYRNLSNRKRECIFDELDKCDLLCANCHMEEHHQHLDY